MSWKVVVFICLKTRLRHNLKSSASFVVEGHDTFSRSNFAVLLSTRSAEDSVWKNVQTFLFDLFVADFADHLKIVGRFEGQFKKKILK